MSRSRALGLLAATLAAAGVLLLLVALPPRPLALDAPVWPERPGRVVAGAFHVHTSRSDGAGTPDDVAAAARRAGLDFLILTDHGDGTRAPDPPRYRDGVLCLDGVEISTTGGHYAAIGLPQAPYPLGGEPRDVVEDVARLGGFGVVAHPDSPKPALAWRDWSAPFDGIEWINADSEWRRERAGRLALALFTYPFRGAETLAAMLGRPDRTLRRWDNLTARRPIVALPGADAHARIGFGGDPYEDGTLLRAPSYETSFRTFALRVELDEPLSGDGAADGAALQAAVRAGRVYSAIDALAGPARFEFEGSAGGRTARMGETLVATGPVTLRARAPRDGEIVLFRNGDPVARGREGELRVEAEPGPGVYRVEVRLPGRGPMPWILGSPIYVRASAEPDAVPPRLPAAARFSLLDEDSIGPWTIERAAGGEAAIEAPEAEPRAEELAFRFELAGGRPAGQFAALARPLADLPDEGPAFDRVSFRGRADRPRRVSVQIRRPDGHRWQRSVYLDPQPRDVTIFFDEMTPIGPVAARRPVPGAGHTLLIVADTTHTRPGTAGRIWIADPGLER